MNLKTIIIPFKTHIGCAHHPMPRSQSPLKNKTWAQCGTAGENQSAIYLYIIKTNNY